MNGREFGEALSREMRDNNQVAEMVLGFTDTQREVWMALEVAIEAAALQSITPGAGESEPTSKDAILTRFGDVRAALNAGPQPDRELGELRTQLDEAIPTETVLASELSRLRAWEKWGREVAKPALELSGNQVARDALAAMPQDAGEPK